MKKKNLLKSAMENLKVNEPIRLPTSRLVKLGKNQVQFTPPKINSTQSENSEFSPLSEADKRELEKFSTKTYTESGESKKSINRKESDSNTDRVQNEPGQNLTRFNIASVKSGLSQNMTGSENDRVNSRVGENQTRLKQDSVKKKPGSKRTGSKFNPLTRKLKKEYLKVGSLSPKDHYSAVDNSLLRKAGLFENPVDFMVYLHLFTHAFGFGRNTCDMGIAQLMKFTDSARNSIRKSLDRLQKAKWIKEIQEFEYGGVSRKWRIFSPYERGDSTDQTYFPKEDQKSGSKTNPVSKNP